MINFESKTFCSAVYQSFYLDTTNVIRPCCVNNTDGPQFDPKEKLIDMYNHEAFKKLRKNLNEGIQDPACQHCWNFESLGKISTRQNLNRWMKNHTGLESLPYINEDFSLNKLSIRYLDIRFSNKCNLKCRSCSPRFSASWFNDYREKYPEIHIEKKLDSKATIESLYPILDSVIEIYFAGGEPLITDQHYEILNYLIKNNRTDVRLKYNTNFSKLVYKDHDVVEYWKKFNTVYIGASLDGSHEKGEYIRKNLKWDHVVANRKRLIEECPNVVFYINCTLSIMNAYNAVELHREWSDLKLINPNNFHLNLLFGPEMLNIKNLPNNHKKALKGLYNSTIEWLNQINQDGNIRTPIESYVAAMNLLDQTPMNDWKKHWDDYMISFDRIRNEDFYSIFPEFSDIKDIKE